MPVAFAIVLILGCLSVFALTLQTLRVGDLKRTVEWMEENAHSELAVMTVGMPPTLVAILQLSMKSSGCKWTLIDSKEKNFDRVIIAKGTADTQSEAMAQARAEANAYMDNWLGVEKAS
jgi:hypothetical protein